jgi:hypothetical protein
MKKKNKTNGKTRIEVSSKLQVGYAMIDLLRRIVKIRLDD